MSRRTDIPGAVPTWIKLLVAGLAWFAVILGLWAYFLGVFG